MICSSLTWFRREVVRDPMEVKLKLKNRKVLLRNETRFVLVYGRRELRQPDRRTVVAEIDRVNNRWHWNDSGTKIVNHRHWRLLSGVKGAMKKSRDYELPPRSRHNRS